MYRMYIFGKAPLNRVECFHYFKTLNNAIDVTLKWEIHAIRIIIVVLFQCRISKLLLSVDHYFYKLNKVILISCMGPPPTLSK